MASLENGTDQASALMATDHLGALQEEQAARWISLRNYCHHNNISEYNNRRLSLHSYIQKTFTMFETEANLERKETREKSPSFATSSLGHCKVSRSAEFIGGHKWTSARIGAISLTQEVPPGCCPAMADTWPAAAARSGEGAPAVAGLKNSLQ